MGQIFPWRSGNRFELLIDGPQFFPLMLTAIALSRTNRDLSAATAAAQGVLEAIRDENDFKLVFWRWNGTPDDDVGPSISGVRSTQPEGADRSHHQARVQGGETLVVEAVRRHGARMNVVHEEVGTGHQAL